MASVNETASSPDRGRAGEDLGAGGARSYLLVVENLPRAKRPVDPATFGRDVR